MSVDENDPTFKAKVEKAQSHLLKFHAKNSIIGSGLPVLRTLCARHGLLTEGTRAQLCDWLLQWVRPTYGSGSHFHVSTSVMIMYRPR